MDSSRAEFASSPEGSPSSLQTEVQMDLERVALDEWELNWAPEAREPNSQMKDDTKIPLLCFASREEEKMSRDLFLWHWETKTSWRPPIETISMHEKFQRTAIGLKMQLEQIQKYRIKRENITDWASNLRFLTGPTPTVGLGSTMNPRPTKQMCTCTCFSWEESAERSKEILPAYCSCASAASPFLLNSKEFRLIQETPNCHHYIAVSYRWWAYNAESQDSKDKKAADHLSTLIDRAVKFSLHHGYQLVWIDQKCIMQDDIADKTIGVQAMDLVYENASLCLAVLQCEITSQEQIGALAKAIDVSLHPVLNEDEWRKWIEYLDHKELTAMAEVIKIITEDDYFSRAWIAQENTAASATILLLRCDPTLIRPDSMGSLDREIQLPLCEFRVACAKLSGAFHDTVNKKIWYYEQAVAQYGEDDRFDDGWRSFRPRRRFPRPPSVEQFKASIAPDQQWQMYFESFLSKSRGSRVARRHQGRYHCSAAEAVEFLSTKHNYEIADRLAIIANLCNYKVRLDAQKLKELGYDLAASVFCLALLNGDLSLARLPDGIKYKDLGVEQFSWDHITLQIGHGQDVLHRTTDMEIGPPSFSWAPGLAEGFTERPRIRKDDKRYALEFLGSNPRLHIQGWLWHRYETLDFSHFAEIFKKRLSNDQGDTKNNSSSLEEKWGMSTTNQLNCFWDLIQELRNRQLSTVAEALWISLIIFNQSVEHILRAAERGTSSPSSIDPRDDDKLRLSIHDTSLENFKDCLPLGPNSTRDIVIPFYWMVQNIIAGDAINLWKLDEAHLNDSDGMAKSTSGLKYAFFNDYHSKSLFTTFTQSVKPPLVALMDEQQLVSWPMSVTNCSDDGFGIYIKVDRTGFDEGRPFNPVVGFWNVGRIPSRPYVLL